MKSYFQRRMEYESHKLEQQRMLNVKLLEILLHVLKDKDFKHQYPCEGCLKGIDHIMINPDCEKGC